MENWEKTLAEISYTADSVKVQDFTGKSFGEGKKILIVQEEKLKYLFSCTLSAEREMAVEEKVREIREALAEIIRNHKPFDYPKSEDTLLEGLIDQRESTARMHLIEEIFAKEGPLFSLKGGEDKGKMV